MVGRDSISHFFYLADEVSLRYNPIQKFGPSDCIASINAIIANFDTLVENNNTAAIQEFKSLFGLGDLVDNRDFAMTIAFPSNYWFVSILSAQF
jgi:hypothetical protein